MRKLRKSKFLSLVKPLFFCCSFIFCVIACRCQSNKSAGAPAPDKGKVKTEPVLQDSLGSIKGDIVDSITNEPIPFVKITLSRNSGSLTMMSSEKGEFDIASQYVNANVLLSAVGYLHQSCRLVAGQTNVFRLKPNSNLLPGVTVAAKIEKNADRIIKRVNKNMEKNYGSPSFDQTFNIYTLTRNYDTLKGEVTHLLRRHYFGDQTSTLAKTWMLRSDTANYDADFLNLIGVPELFLEMIADRYDIIRKGVIIGKTRSENFNFKLLGHYQDEIYGPVYRISFKPRSPYYALFWGINTHTSFGYFIGEMLVSKNDYAVVNIKYTLERDVADIRKGVEDLYHSRNWKADRVSKIVPKSLTFNDEYSYIKDTVTGKYFVKTINLDCFETGHQVENNRNVQLYFKIDINSMGIENVGAGTN